MWMSLGIISIQSMHTSHKTSQNEGINLQNIPLFFIFETKIDSISSLSIGVFQTHPNSRFRRRKFEEFWALKLAIENDLWDVLNWIFSMTCRDFPSFAMEIYLSTETFYNFIFQYVVVENSSPQ